MPEAKRVLYVDTLTTLFGGAEISLLAVMKHLDASRYQPNLLTSGPGGLIDAARQAGIPAWTQDFPWLSRRRPWKYISSILNIARIIRRQRIALVHTNCERSPVYVMRACQITRTPYVCHIRDNVRDWRSHSRAQALKRAQIVIFNSIYMATVFSDVGLNHEQTKVVYSPIDILDFIEKKPKLRLDQRAHLGIPSNATCFAILGQIQQRKGQLDFVQAAARLDKYQPDCWFLIIGDAHNAEDCIYREEVKRVVTENHMIERVIFTGHQVDVAPYFAMIDVLVVPSDKEPFGRVAVEALAAGRSVIAYQTGGLCEIIKHGENGLLVPTGDIQALAEAMAQLAQDSNMRIRLANNGRKFAQLYDVTYHASQVQAIYDRVLSVA